MKTRQIQSKLLLTLSVAMIAPIPAQAQWSPCTNGICYAGNVGIGTTNPGAMLDVEGQSYSLGGFWLSPPSSPYSGTIHNAPWYGLGFSNLTLSSGDPPAVQLAGWGGLNFQTGNGQMVILQTGNVGIGTTNPQYPLQVNGTIAASEVIVTTSLSDYVFDPNYQLRPLQEVADYVKQESPPPRHPLRSEAKPKGVSLAKIEELTLHMIQAEKENRELRERIANLERAASAR